MSSGTNPLQDFLRHDEVAAILGVHPMTLHKWQWAGTAPPRIEVSPRRFVYSKRALAAWMATRDAAPAPATPASPAPAIRVRTRSRPAPSNPPEAITNP
jgi:predicted DNA-binding transcriptional regulator AlpA